MSTRLVTLFAAGILAFPLVALAQDHDHDHHEHVSSAGAISVTHGWARAAEAGGTTNVFFELVNEGEEDHLVSAEVSPDIAGAVTIVGYAMQQAEASFVDIGEIEIPAGETAFDPFGLSLQLSDLTVPLTKGDHFDLTLNFEGVGPVEIHVDVEAREASQHSHAGHAH